METTQNVAAQSMSIVRPDGTMLTPRSNGPYRIEVRGQTVRIPGENIEITDAHLGMNGHNGLITGTLDGAGVAVVVSEVQVERLNEHDLDSHITAVTILLPKVEQLCARALDGVEIDSHNVTAIITGIEAGLRGSGDRVRRRGSARRR